VVYSDGDEEELSLAEVLQLIDIRNLQSREGTDKEFIEEDLEDVVEDAQRVVENNDGSDSDADSKNSHYSNEEVTATILRKEECQMENNDLLKVQLLVQLYLYDQSTSPLHFNKVNDGTGEVNKVAALQILQYCEERHMSRTEADEYLKSQHKLIEVVTGKPFDMVKSFKTLKRVFLDTMDRKLPLSYCDIHLPQRFFETCRTQSNNPLPSLKAAYIPLEYAIGLLLLKTSPDNIIDNMKAEFWKGLDRQGVQSVQRIYTKWSSSKYAVDIQRLIRDRIDTEIVPLILYFSIFIDKGAMNKGQTRSATQVSISLQNINGTCCQSLIGFVPDNSGTSPEVLDGLLEEQGVNKTSRKYILQYTSRQREWDYLQSTITPFLERQETEGGFDAQVGTGMNKKF
jgi:hypothetical protein